MTICDKVNQILGYTQQEIRIMLRNIKMLKNWYLYYLLIGKDKVFITKSGDKFYVEGENRWEEKKLIDVIAEVYYLHMYGQHSTFDIEDQDIVVDVGANIGIFTIYAAKRTIHGKVYSFEPFPKTFEILNKNVYLNGLKNVETFKMGIGRKRGVQKFYIASFSIFNTSYPELRNGEKLDETIVNTLSINDLFEGLNCKKIDFLKMDCEGAEYDAIFNTKPEYFERIKKIVMELHYPIQNYTYDDMIIFLTEKGYKVDYDESRKVKIMNEKIPFGMMLYAERKNKNE